MVFQWKTQRLQARFPGIACGCRHTVLRFWLWYFDDGVAQGKFHSGIIVLPSCYETVGKEIIRVVHAPPRQS